MKNVEKAWKSTKKPSPLLSVAAAVAHSWLKPKLRLAVIPAKPSCACHFSWLPLSQLGQLSGLATLFFAPLLPIRPMALPPVSEFPSVAHFFFVSWPVSNTSPDLSFFTSWRLLSTYANNTLPTITCLTTIIIVCFSILVFCCKFQFPPFMVLIVALLDNGTIMMLSVDCMLPSSQPDSWDLGEIFTYTVAYGLYLTLST